MGHSINQTSVISKHYVIERVSIAVYMKGEVNGSRICLKRLNLLEINKFTSKITKFPNQYS